MGCDIHIRVQTRPCAGGTWETVPYMLEPWLTREESAAHQGQYPYREQWELYDAYPGLKLPACFTGRNYQLFGILADVRNGSWGFRWPSIAPDRGLPDDIDPEPSDEDLWARENPGDGNFWLGDHSHTWMTLEEIEDYPWDTTGARVRGVLSVQDYIAWQAQVIKDHGPQSYCGGAGGRDVRTVDEAVYLDLSQSGQLDPTLTYYIRCEWQETARAATNEWVDQVVPPLRAWAKDQEVRLVMGFDS